MNLFSWMQLSYWKRDREKRSVESIENRAYTHFSPDGATTTLDNLSVTIGNDSFRNQYFSDFPGSTV
jgi:hypothetical protein